MNPLTPDSPDDQSAALCSTGFEEGVDAVLEIVQSAVTQAATLKQSAEEASADIAKRVQMLLVRRSEQSSRTPRDAGFVSGVFNVLSRLALNGFLSGRDDDEVLH